MNVLPVIQRELRAQARQAFTYWLRVAGAGAVLGMAAYFAFKIGLLPNSGGELFSYVHGMLHVSIWLLVPLLTADCVSRERREGTLGLLFLTPLKGRDIIVAKGAVHGLRAAMLLVAAAPIAMLPALVGGVSGHQVFASLTLNSAATCLALGAGMVGSCWSRSWVRSLLLSYILTAAFAIVFCNVLIALFGLALGQPARISFERGFLMAIGINPDFYLTGAYRLPYMSVSALQLFRAVLTASVNLFLLSLSALMVMVMVAALATMRSWQERPPNPVLESIRRRFCTPVVMLDLLKRWMKRTLDRNPIGWLERRSWSGRLVIWGWLAVMVSLYSAVLTDARFFLRSFDPLHSVMGTALVASMAFNAAGSFRRERESRVLELLLVSPMNEWQLIAGRLRGLWGQFLPSLLLLLGGWTYLSLSTGQFQGSVRGIVTTAVTFVTVPVIGLYFSLVCRSFLAGLIWTVLAGLILPLNLLPLLRLGIALFYWHLRVPQERLTTLDVLGHPAVLEILVAGCLYFNLHRRLVERRFATEST